MDKIDKDAVILKHQQQTTFDIESEITDLQNSNEDQERRLSELQAKLEAMGARPTKKRPLFRNIKKTANDRSTQELSYESLFEEAYASLSARGLDPDSVDYSNLVSDEELEKIVRELNKPLPREEKWTKADFIVVFIAAIVGSVVDFVLSNRNNKATGQHSKFSEWLNDTFHEGKHPTNAPIDYQGKGFGGGYHRELSKGHDIARFAEGIKMFKNGTFEGVRYVNGVAEPVKVVANQFGNPYATLSTIEAIIGYAQHMFADLFSKVSLPFPGYSFLTESSNRDVRKFAADMYHNGFNCKNIIIQSASTIAIEVIIRIYFSIMSVKKYHDQIEIAEDYSNLEALKKFIKPENKEKLHEMLLVAHAIVTAMNVGKVVITKNLASINVTEIISVIRYGVSVVTAMNKRHGEYARLIYHAGEINELWEKLDSEYSIDETAFIEDYPEKLIIS